MYGRTVSPLTVLEGSVNSVLDLIQRVFSPRIWVPIFMVIGVILGKSIDTHDYALTKIGDLPIFYSILLACTFAAFPVFLSVFIKAYRVRHPSDVIVDVFFDYVYAIVCVVILTIAVMQGWGDRSLKML